MKRINTCCKVIKIKFILVIIITKLGNYLGIVSCWKENFSFFTQKVVSITLEAQSNWSNYTDYSRRVFEY